MHHIVLVDLNLERELGLEEVRLSGRLPWSLSWSVERKQY